MWSRKADWRGAPVYPADPKLFCFGTNAVLAGGFASCQKRRLQVIRGQGRRLGFFMVGQGILRQQVLLSRIIVLIDSETVL